jgi:hypothetical protein
MQQVGYDSRVAKVIASCKDGKATVTLREQDSADITNQLPAATWATLWSELETAKWRELTTACATGRGYDSKYGSTEPMGVKKVGIEITDGTTTKKFLCLGTKLTKQHIALTDAFGDAALAATAAGPG